MCSLFYMEVSVMFNSPGKKIKKVAYVLFWVAEVLYMLACTLFLAWSLVVQEIDPLLALFLFLVALVVGAFSIWFSWLLVYGFGELIDRNCHTDDLVSSVIPPK